VLVPLDCLTSHPDKRSLQGTPPSSVSPEPERSNRPRTPSPDLVHRNRCVTTAAISRVLPRYSTSSAVLRCVAPWRTEDLELLVVGYSFHGGLIGSCLGSHEVNERAPVSLPSSSAGLLGLLRRAATTTPLRLSRPFSLSSSPLSVCPAPAPHWRHPTKLPNRAEGDVETLAIHHSTSEHFAGSVVTRHQTPSPPAISLCGPRKDQDRGPDPDV